jgi:hypothetical protein
VLRAVHGHFTIIQVFQAVGSSCIVFVFVCLRLSASVSSCLVCAVISSAWNCHCNIVACIFSVADLRSPIIVIHSMPTEH